MNADKNITLSTEIELVDSYLGILKARYGDNLSYEISIAPNYTAYLIPALTLQPIVENAIIHGCEMKRGKSIIQIFSSSDTNYLYLNVTDNGIGIEETKLDQLNAELANVTSVDGTDSENFSITESIGLINVNKRIRLKYGDDYGIHIDSSASTGTHVILKLPLKWER
jgi:two-component system sensor histidine kinase YesM